MNALLQKNFISTKEASLLSGYNADYLSRLCREKRIAGSQIGRTWLIERASLESFMESQVDRKIEIAESLARERGLEYRKANSPSARITKVTDDLEERVRAVTQSVFSVLSVVSVPSEAPMFGSRAVAVALTALILAGSVTLAGSGVVSRTGEALLASAFDARSFVLSRASNIGLVAQERSEALVLASREEVQKVDATLAYALDERVETLPLVVSKNLAQEYPPVEVSKVAFDRAEEIYARYPVALSSTEIATGFTYAVTHPAETLAAVAHGALRAYSTIGVYALNDIETVLALHLRMVEAGGEGLFSASVSVRDTAYRTPLAVGTVFVDGSEAVMSLYEDGVYAYVENIAVVPETIVGAVYHIGNTSGAVLATGIQLAPVAYEEGVLAFAETSSSAAALIANGSYALGKGTNEQVSGFTQAQDRFIGQGVAGVRLALAGLNGRATQMAAAIESGPSVASNQALQFAGDITLRIENTGGEILAASPLASIDFDQFIPGFLKNVTAVIARAVGSAFHGIFGPLAGFFGASEEVGLAVIPGDTVSPGSNESEGAEVVAGDTNNYNGPVTIIRNEYPTVNYGGVPQSYVDERFDFLRRTLYNRIEDVSGDRTFSGDINNSTITESTITDSSFSGGVIENSEITGGTIVGSALDVATTTITGSLTVNGDLSVSGNVSGNSTTTNATTTNFYATNGIIENIFGTNATFTNATTTNFYAVAATILDGFFTNFTATLANITTAIIANLTATNATFTNATTTNATSTGSLALTYVTPSRLLSVGANGVVASTNLSSWISGTLNQLTVTDNGIGGITLSLPSTIVIGSSQPTTIASNGATSTFGGGLQATFVEGIQYLAGPYVLATSTTATSAFSGNIAVGRNTTLGTTAADFLTVNSSISSNLIPSANNTYDIGSVGNNWNRIYVDEVVANNLSAASTSISGTVSESFTINSDNASADAEDSSIVFNRGSASPNALITWNAATDRFEFNMPVFSANGIFTNATTTSLFTSTLGLGSGNYFTSLLGNGLTNVGGALTVSTTSLASGFFQQGGNSFGTTALLGTNDAQDLLFQTGGAERMRIGASGNVSIGTTTSSALLTMNKDQDTITVTTLTNLSTTANAGGRFTVSSDVAAVSLQANSLISSAANYAGGAGGVGLWTSGTASGGISISARATTGAIRFYSGGNAERVRIDPSGNMSIGDTGGIYNSAFTVATTSVATTNSQINVRGARAAIVSGDLIGGVDFTSNDTNLTAPGIRTAAIQAVANTTHTASALDTDLIFSGTNGTTYAERMRLTGAGNLGIGTTTPSTALSVVGTGTFSQIINSGLTADTLVYADASKQLTSTTIGNGLTFTGGTLAVSTTSLASGFFQQGGNSFGATATLGTNDSNSLAFETGGTTRLTIDTSGNVGVGTTTPQARLSLVAASGIGDSLIIASTTGSRMLTVNSQGSLIFSGSGQSYKQYSGADESGPAVFINRTIGSEATANEHGIIDATLFGRSTMAYNSYDSQAVLTGSNNYDHFAGFQNRGKMNSSGSLSDYYSFGSFPDLSAGATTNVFGFYAANPSGAGAITNNYGVYVENQTRGTNNYAVYTAGTAKSYFGGNVGIGTTTPTSLLDLYKNTDGYAKITVRNPNTGTDALSGIDFLQDIGGTGSIYVTGNTFDGNGDFGALPGYANSLWLDASFELSGGLKLVARNADIGFYAGSRSVQNVTISGTNGNLGVGSTTPFARLSVKGAGTGTGIAFQTTDSANVPGLSITDNGRLMMGTTTSTFPAFFVSSGSQTLVGQRDSSSTSLTSSVVSGAAVRNANTTNNNYSALQFLGIDTGGTGQTFGHIANVMTDHTAGSVDSDFAFVLRNNNTLSEAMRITGTGSVGIGTTTPTAQLAINSSVTEAIRISSISNGRGIFADNGSSNGIFSFTRQDAVTPGSLSISAFGGIGFTGNSNSYNNAVASAYQMYLSPAGNVGIGTSTPDASLVIAGTGTNTTLGQLNTNLRLRTQTLTGNAGNEISFSGHGGTLGENVYASIAAPVTANSSGAVGYLSFNTKALGSDSSLTERLRITGAGKVGIGTTSPQNLLHVNGGASSVQVARFSNTGTGAQLLLEDTDQADASTPFYYLSSSAGNLSIGNANRSGLATTGSTERLTITSAGNVGIGTAVPTEKFQVLDGSASTFISVVGPQNTIGSGPGIKLFENANLTTIPAGFDIFMDSGDNRLAVRSYSNSLTPIERFSILRDSGNVGIGTANPASHKLVVVGGNANTLRIDNAGEQYTSADFYNNGSSKATTYYDNTASQFIMRTTSAADIGFDTNLTRRMTILSSGNVGIGATNPQALLQVAGTTFINTTAQVAGVSAAKLTVVQTAATADWTAVIKGGTTSGSSYGLRVDAGTNSSDYALNVNNSSATNLFTVRGDGNVGIGTSNPSYQLTVVDGTADGIVGRFSQTATSGSPFGIYVTATGASTQNIAGYFDASGATANIGVFINGPSAASSNYALYSGAAAQSYFAGNVGIGAANPAEALHIERSSSNPAIELKRTGGTNNPDYKITADESLGGLVFGRTGIANDVIFKNGNVGIGTTTPSSLMHVAGSAGSTLNYILEPAGWSGLKHRLGVQYSGDTSVLSNNALLSSATAGTLDNTAQTGSALILGASGSLNYVQASAGSGSRTFTSRLYVDSAGSVGIGDTTPDARLDILQSSDVEAQGLQISRSNDSDYTRMFKMASLGSLQDPLVFSSNFATNHAAIGRDGSAYFAGNVGIGITTPSSKLTVAGNIELVTGANRFIQIGSASNYYYNLQSTGDDFQIIEGGDPSKVRLHIDYPNGNVGIGETAPSNLLTVGTSGSSANTLPTLRIQGQSVSDGVSAYGSYGSFILNSTNTYTGTARRFMVTNALNANTFAIIRSIDGTTDPTLGTAGAITSGTADFVISNAGNVGIGTTAPTGKLDVMGTFADVSLTADSAATANFRTASHVQLAISSQIASPYTTSLQAKHTSANGSAYPIALNPLGGNVGIGLTLPNSRFSVLETSGAGRVIADFANSNRDRRLEIVQDISGDATSYIGLNARENGSSLGRDFVLQTGGIERMRVAFSTGNVGIGTTAPGDKLHVYDATGTVGNPTIRLESLVGGYGAGVEAGSVLTGGSYLAMGKAVWDGEGSWNTTASTQDSYFTLHTAENGTLTERLRITSAGNVGIGTTNPSYQLQIAKDTGGTLALSTGGFAGTIASPISPAIKFLGYTNVEQGEILVDDRSGNVAGGFMRFRTADASSVLQDRLIITRDGYVGIGTVSPSVRLDVRTPASAASMTLGSATGVALGVQSGAGSFGWYSGVNNSTGNSWIQAGRTDGNTAAYNLSLQASGGNVGIGTNNPTTGKLQVAGTANNWTGYFVGNSTASQSYGMLIDAGTNSSDTSFRIRSYSGADHMLVRGDGRIGIGTASPTVSRLDIVDTTSQLQLGRAGVGAWSTGITNNMTGFAGHTGQLVWNPTGAQGSSLSSIVISSSGGTTAQHAFATNGNAYHAGNVGIGNTNPARKLDVINDGSSNAVGAFQFGASGAITTVGGSASTGRIQAYTNGYVGSATLELNPDGGSVAVGSLISCGGVQTNGSGVMSCTSDERLKDTQGAFATGLSGLRGITPQTYTWKNGTDYYDGGIAYSGFIAQNVGANIPEAMGEGANGFKQINTTTILAASVNAIKELDIRTLALAPAAENAEAHSLAVSADASVAGMLTVTGTGTFNDALTAASILSNGSITGVAFLTETNDSLPNEVLTGGEADLYKMANYAITGMQTLAERTDLILAQLDTIDSRLAALELSQSAEPGFLGISPDMFKSLLAGVGIAFEEGITSIEKLVAERLTVGSVEKPTGITLYDEETGEPYCLSIGGGSQNITPGECQIATPTTPEVTPDPVPQPTDPVVVDEEPPTPPEGEEGGLEPVFPTPGQTNPDPEEPPAAPEPVVEEPPVAPEVVTEPPPAPISSAPGAPTL